MSLNVHNILYVLCQYVAYVCNVLCVRHVLLVTNEVIKTALVDGQRPPLNEITGPADMVLFAKKWISVCWQQTPEIRPSFHGK